MVRPLHGKRVLVTRPVAQAARLSSLIEAAGGVPVELPVIEIRPTEDWNEVDAAIHSLAAYDWLVFTSVNAVRIWSERMVEIGAPPQSMSARQIAAIGPATSRAVEELGARVDLVPRSYVAESLLEELLRRGVRRKAVLLPRATEARNVLRDGLVAAGAAVTQVALYTTSRPSGTVGEVLHSTVPDIVTFTSSSTVRSFVALLAEEDLQLPRRALVACIGPITAATACELGLWVDVIAEVHTMAGLIEAVETHLASRNGGAYADAG